MRAETIGQVLRDSWRVSVVEDGDGDVVRVVAGPPEYHVALVYGHGGDAATDTDRMASARLIAAAPGLLAALLPVVDRENMMSGDDSDDGNDLEPICICITAAELRAARAAIARAEGGAK